MLRPVRELANPKVQSRLLESLSAYAVHICVSEMYLTWGSGVNLEWAVCKFEVSKLLWPEVSAGRRLIVSRLFERVNRVKQFFIWTL
jgi:hypothetical protein